MSQLTLKQQLLLVAERRVNREYAVMRGRSIPALIRDLGYRAFIEQWDEGPDTRAIRTADSLIAFGAFNDTVKAVD